MLTRGLVRWWTQVLLALLALPVKNTVDSWRLRAKRSGAGSRARLLGNGRQGEEGAEQELEGGIRIAGYFPIEILTSLCEHLDDQRTD